MVTATSRPASSVTVLRWNKPFTIKAGLTQLLLACTPFHHHGHFTPITRTTATQPACRKVLHQVEDKASLKPWSIKPQWLRGAATQN